MTCEDSVKVADKLEFQKFVFFVGFSHIDVTWDLRVVVASRMAHTS